MLGHQVYCVVGSKEVFVKTYQGCELRRVGSLPYFCGHKQLGCKILHHPGKRLTFSSEGKICPKCSRFRDITSRRKLSREVMLANLYQLRQIILKLGDSIVDLLPAAKNKIMGIDWSIETSGTLKRTIELLFADRKTGSE